MHRCNINDVVRTQVGNGNVLQVERLTDNVAVYIGGEDLAETVLIDVGRSENGLIQVLPGAGVVIVVGNDADLSVPSLGPEPAHSDCGQSK